MFLCLGGRESGFLNMLILLFVSKMQGQFFVNSREEQE